MYRIIIYHVYIAHMQIRARSGVWGTGGTLSPIILGPPKKTQPASKKVNINAYILWIT